MNSTIQALNNVSITYSNNIDYIIDEIVTITRKPKEILTSNVLNVIDETLNTYIGINTDNCYHQSRFYFSDLDFNLDIFHPFKGRYKQGYIELLYEDNPNSVCSINIKDKTYRVSYSADLKINWHIGDIKNYQEYIERVISRLKILKKHQIINYFDIKIQRANLKQYERWIEECVIRKVQESKNKKKYVKPFIKDLNRVCVSLNELGYRKIRNHNY